MSLRIVHLFTHSSVTRGGAVQGLLLAQALQDDGHRVTSFFHDPFFHREKGDRRSLAQASSDLDVRRINMKNPASYLWLRKWVQKEKIDVLHSHRSLALLFAYFSTLDLRGLRPVLIVNRGTTYPLPNPLIKHVYRSDRLDHIIAVAEAVKRSLLKQHIEPRKISVVYGSFDENRFHPKISDGKGIRKALKVPESAPLIVCIAAVDSRKGLEFIVRAAHVVTRRYPGARFLLVGNIDDRYYHQRIQREVSQLALEQVVLFVGHRTDIPEILAAADVSINASTEGEGFTGALRESLAMRKPVVCTDVCGNPELIKNGEHGWVVRPSDSSSLAAAIFEVLENSEEARRRADEGYAMISQVCSNKVRCRQVEQIYYSLCRRKAPERHH